ncbi:hypothetical protein N9948_00680 [bacterium]|nr:hypothetical protein [bacterium]
MDEDRVTTKVKKKLARNLTDLEEELRKEFESNHFEKGLKTVLTQNNRAKKEIFNNLNLSKYLRTLLYKSEGVSVGPLKWDEDRKSYYPDPKSSKYFVQLVLSTTLIASDYAYNEEEFLKKVKSIPGIGYDSKKVGNIDSIVLQIPVNKEKLGKILLPLNRWENKEFVAKIKEKLAGRRYKKPKYFEVNSRVNIEYDGKVFDLDGKKIEEKKIPDNIAKAMKEDFEKSKNNSILYITLKGSGTPHTPATYHHPAEGGEVEDAEIEEFESDSGGNLGLKNDDFDFIFDIMDVQDFEWED